MPFRLPNGPRWRRQPPPSHECGAGSAIAPCCCGASGVAVASSSWGLLPRRPWGGGWPAIRGRTAIAPPGGRRPCCRTTWRHRAPWWGSGRSATPCTDWGTAGNAPGACWGDRDHPRLSTLSLARVDAAGGLVTRPHFFYRLDALAVENGGTGVGFPATIEQPTVRESPRGHRSGWPDSRWGLWCPSHEGGKLQMSFECIPKS